MRLVDEITNALGTVIGWIGIVFSKFSDYLEISEWAIFRIAATIIGLFLGYKALRK